MPLSPRTQSMMQAQGPQDPQALFEQGFQELALTQLASELPEIADQVASLKILEATPEENRAVGTFIVLHGDDEVHIPAVLADNEMMPFDVMYVKSIDMMLPLQPEWFSELDNMDVETMGKAVEPPDTLRTDEDIRNVVVPPTTGRYSYASENTTLLLPQYLHDASNRVKESFFKTLERHPKLAKHAFEIYGHETIAAALRPHAEKVASTTQHANFMTIETPVREIKSVFGENARDAMRDIALKGYSVRDDREQVNEVIDTEQPLRLEVPSVPGFYRVYMTDGTAKECVVFPHVKQLDQLADQHTLAPRSHFASKSVNEVEDATPRMGCSADGELFFMRREFMAQVLDAEEVTPALRSYVTAARPGTPRNGQRGFFFDPDKMGQMALEPIKIELVVKNGNSRHVYCKAWEGYKRVCIVQIEGSPISKPKAFSATTDLSGRRVYDHVPYGFANASERANPNFGRDTELVVLVPWHWRFVPINKVIEPTSILGDPASVKALYHDALTLSGAQRVKVKEASAGLFYLDGDNLTPFECVKKLANGYNVSVPSAELIVEKAREKRAAEVYVVNEKAMRQFQWRLKRAAEGESATEDPAVVEEEMAAAPPMEDPAMMAPPEPPPPSPVEIAAQEVAQQLMQQNDAIQQELMSKQESLQTQLGAVHMVMQRATQIAGEMGLPTPGGETMPMGPAPGMGGDPSMMGGDPSMMGGDPSMMGGDPSMMGGDPSMMGGDPSMMGGDPSMMGGDPSMMGGDPSMMGGQEMGPGMPVEEPSMMESAMGNMMDPEMFDAAAIAQMATHDDYDNTAQSYVPDLRTALDALGRLLVEFRMRGGELKGTIGEDTYSDMRDRLELLFSELGTALLGLASMTSQEEPMQA